MRILYVRSAPYELDIQKYNCQEMGLAKAFCEAGYDVDIVLYSRHPRDLAFEHAGKQIRVLYKHGVRVLRSGIYPSVLKRAFLQQYEYVITSEYSQIMSVLTSKRCDKTYVYNGVYYNLFMLPFMEKIYDKLFKNILNNNVNTIFCKTKESKQYLRQKGLEHTAVVGVGLDIDAFKRPAPITSEVAELAEIMKAHPTMLSVGAISPRKNTKLIVAIFNRLKQDKKYQDLRLVLVGKGDARYTRACLNECDPAYRDDLIHIPTIDNAQLRYVYPNANVYISAATQEIFGMVLAESMYFGDPMVASNTAGARTLVVEDETGYIVDSDDLDEWAYNVSRILDDKDLQRSMSRQAHQRIIDNFMWSNVADRMLTHMEAK